MYMPSAYQQESREEIFALIERDGFATLLTPGSTETISHLPMILVKGDDGHMDLICHMARANAHWRELQKAGRAKAIFHGPHAYISPAWYAPEASNVPTWNYTVAHAEGVFEIIEDKAAAFAAMRDMVTKFETKYGTGWRLPENERAVDGLMNGIVVFRIRNPSFTAKFKLSQKHDDFNRRSVIKNLDGRDDEATALAAAMKRSFGA